MNYRNRIRRAIEIFLYNKEYDKAAGTLLRGLRGGVSVRSLEEAHQVSGEINIAKEDAIMDFKGLFRND